MEKNHPIGDLMSTTMQKIREMVDVNTIIGAPIQTGEVTIIPVSKVSFGFASGGSDFTTKNQKPEADNAFGGGSGAGVNIIAAAVEQGQALPWDWIVKILLTALTLSSGFKGGEVVPSFFVGATFGCVAAPLLGIPAGFGAALGLAGVFCGASNCVVASLVLAIELFGAQGLWYFAIVCGITYALSGYAGLYHSQLFLTDKLEPEYRIIRGHNHH